MKSLFQCKIKKDCIATGNLSENCGKCAHGQTAQKFLDERWAKKYSGSYRKNLNFFFESSRVNRNKIISFSHFFISFLIDFSFFFKIFYQLNWFNFKWFLFTIIFLSFSHFSFFPSWKFLVSQFPVVRIMELISAQWRRFLINLLLRPMNVVQMPDILTLLQFVVLF